VRYAFYTKLSDGVIDACDADNFFTKTSRSNDSGKQNSFDMVSLWQSGMSGLEEDAERGPAKGVGVVGASLAEVKGGLKLMEAYNEQIKMSTSTSHPPKVFIPFEFKNSGT
jgi:hypothetical protein